MDLKIYHCVIDEDIESGLEVNFVSLVDRPAIGRNFLTFSEQEQKLAFAVNDEEMIISGPAMIADLPIYRKDEELGEYYTVFDKASIKAIALKFFKKGYNQSFNLQHKEGSAQTCVTIFQSFLTNEAMGIMPLKGYEDVADGSWFLAAKVDDPKLWAEIKAGNYRGFSVEGLFSYIKKETEEQMLAQLESLLSKLSKLN